MLDVFDQSQNNLIVMNWQALNTFVPTFRCTYGAPLRSLSADFIVS